MNTFKHYFFTLLITSSLFIFAHIVPLVLVDPLNISKFDILSDEFYIKEMRFQAASIINKFEFDSAIVGTSLAANFNSSEANKKLGGKFKNLSLDGSLLNERTVILKYLLAKKNIKTLIVSLHNTTTVQSNQGIPIDSWSFLYNNNYIDDFYLYTNKKYSPYINCHSLFNHKLLNFIYGTCPINKIVENIDSLTEWQSNPEHNKRFGGIEKWLEHKNNDQVSHAITEIISASNLIKKNKVQATENMRNLIEPQEFTRNLLPLIKQNLDTRFILFFPPYSIFKYAIDLQTAPYSFSQYKKLVERVVLETEMLPNTEIYWFSNQKFIEDIANYKDLTHYNAFYNSVFLDSFSQKHSIINVDNYKKLLGELENKANSVNLPEFAKKFK